MDGVTHLREKAKQVVAVAKSSGLKDSDIDLIVDAQDLPRAVSYKDMESSLPMSQNARTWTVLFQLLGWVGAPITATSPHSPPCIPSRRPTLEVLRFVIPRAKSLSSFRGRGSSSRKRLDFGQYVGHAIYLVQQEFFRDVCNTGGDEYVDFLASRIHGTGNMTTWRVASLQRHVGVVAAQLARIPARRRKVK